MHQEAALLHQHQAVHDAHDGVDRVWIRRLTHGSVHTYRVPLRAKVAPVERPAPVRVAYFQVFVDAVTVTYCRDHLDVEPDASVGRLGHEPGVSMLEHRDEIAIGRLNVDRQAADHDRGLTQAAVSYRRHQTCWNVHDRLRIE